MALLGQPATAVAGSFEAVLGSTSRQTFVRLIAAEMRLGAEIMSSVSALEGRLLFDPGRAGTRAGSGSLSRPDTSERTVIEELRRRCPRPYKWQAKGGAILEKMRRARTALDKASVA
jgi:hypothetical protein